MVRCGQWEYALILKDLQGSILVRVVTVDRESMEQRLITCADFGFDSWERATSRNFPFSQFPVSPTGFYVVPIEIERNQHVMSRCELTCNLKVWMREERQKF